MNDEKVKTLLIDKIEDANIVIIGFPYDEGTIINNGRSGAKRGPDVFRSFMKKCGTVFNPEYNLDISKIKIFDHGNIDADLLSLTDAHNQLRLCVKLYLDLKKTVFVIGGSNDQSYPNVRALMDYCIDNNDTIDVVNIDAHLDVRPLNNGLVHSGCPFFQMLTDPDFVKCKGKFIEYGKNIYILLISTYSM
jgi:formiminoglutamase